MVFRRPLNRQANLLFFLRVFQRIDGHGQNDNRTFDDVLPIRVYADIAQAVVNQGKDNHADNHAEYRTDTAAERHAADHTGCNRVHFIHKTQIVGGRTDASRLQQAAESVKHAGQGVDANQV